LIHSLRNFNLLNFSHSPPFSNEKSPKTISSFSLLISKIQSLLKKQEKFLSSIRNTTKVAGVLMVFDEIFAADALEEGFAQKLLSIGKVPSEPMNNDLTRSRMLLQTLK
jgi:hypothetical protein